MGQTVAQADGNPWYASGNEARMGRIELG
jgi:hypothetical protein